MNKPKVKMVTVDGSECIEMLMRKVLVHDMVLNATALMFASFATETKLTKREIKRIAKLLHDAEEMQKQIRVPKAIKE